MAILIIDQPGLLGAIEIRDWLKHGIEEAGYDRLAYTAIANYILSDIEDSISDTQEQDIGEWLGNDDKNGDDLG